MRRPLIKDGKVVNVIVIEDGADWTPPAGHILGEPHPDAVIGATVTTSKKGTTYTRPQPVEVEPEPDRLAILEQAVTALADGDHQAAKQALQAAPDRPA